ncbi:MAG: 50S ribosomal protein L17 [Bacteroidota bacterium]|nr:50S ribosomal protein L17 [Bacteroidota bacterium]MEC9187014.1 50S ribosomal protein L17 [Bacteroidota bacterium]MED5301717.1 50S ribosomal protein L17 [Bacteroidota bacterium]
MRHGKKINHLSRKTAHRSAMLANMACSLIEHKRINTTLAKAKALRKYVEPLITKSKDDTTHNRRVVFSYLKDKKASSTLFRDVAPKISDRPGGYTRIIKLNNRLGDNAEMAMIELVDFNELLTKDQVKKKKTRRRGGKKTASSAPVSDPAPIEDAEIIETEEVEVIDENKEEKSEDTANETKAEKKEDTLDEKEDESSEKDKNKD